MAIKLARKYILVFPKRDNLRTSILKILRNNEDIEFEKIKEEEIKEELKKQVSELDYQISSFKFVISYLEPYAKKMPFLKKLNCPRILVENKIKENFTRTPLLEDIIKTVIEFEKEKEVFEREKKEIQEKLAGLDKFKNLDFIPSATEYTNCLLMSLPQSLDENFQKFVLKQNIWYKKIQQVSGKSIFVLLFLGKNEKLIKEEITKIKGEEIKYEFSELPKRIISNLIERRKELEVLERNLNQKILNQAKSLEECKIYYDLLLSERAKITIEEQTLSGIFIDCLGFYSLMENKDKVEKELKKISRGIFIIPVKEKEENLPVVLQNHNLIKPLQYITDIFGLPQAREVDPTPFLAIFFLVFFAVCLTDAGYGLLLSLLTLLLLLFFRKLFSDTRLLTLLFYGGIFTIIAGVLFGGYFGVSAEQIRFLPFLGTMKKIDPIKDTVLFMGITFLLGYLQIFFAQFVRIISGVKNKNKELVILGIAWAFLYLFGAISLISFKIASLKTMGLLGLGAGGLFVIFAESMGRANFFVKPLIGLVKFLQGLIGTMSDILSYSRLMALGLATGVIALIVNQIAMIFKDLIPVVGWGVGALILIVGHSFNLVINVLSGFIHSGRLQFVEFFPKFLEGGGRRFNPLKPKLKYIEFQ